MNVLQLDGASCEGSRLPAILRADDAVSSGSRGDRRKRQVEGGAGLFSTHAHF